MPVNVKEKGTSEFEGLTGNYYAKPSEVAEKLVEGRDGRPDSVRIVFEVKGKDDKLSMFVPLHESAIDRLRPFIPNIKDVPTDEMGMREFLAANMPGNEFLCFALNGTVRSVTAAPGKHRVQLVGLHKNIRKSDSQPRIRFFTENEKHETVTWTAPYEGFDTKRGDTPEQDDIDINVNKHAYLYMLALGLNHERFVEEMTEAYKGGKLFSRLGLDGPEPGYFSDPDDLTDELYRAAKRHSPNRWCEVEVVDNKQYGIGPKRGQSAFITLTPVIVEGAGTDNAEFQREVAVFLELWDNLTKIVLQKDDARFMAGGHYTADGVALIKSVLKPLVVAYPNAVLVKDTEGNPGIAPETPSPATWTLDGLVCANFTAERMFKLTETERFEIVNLTDHTGAKVVEWAKEAVPEWATIGQESEAEVL